MLACARCRLETLILNGPWDCWATNTHAEGLSKWLTNRHTLRAAISASTIARAGAFVTVVRKGASQASRLQSYHLVSGAKHVHTFGLKHAIFTQFLGQQGSETH